MTFEFGPMNKQDLREQREENKEEIERIHAHLETGLFAERGMDKEALMEEAERLADENRRINRYLKDHE